MLLFTESSVSTMPLPNRWSMVRNTPPLNIQIVSPKCSSVMIGRTIFQNYTFFIRPLYRIIYRRYECDLPLRRRKQKKKLHFYLVNVQLKLLEGADIRQMVHKSMTIEKRKRNGCNQIVGTWKQLPSKGSLSLSSFLLFEMNGDEIL